jgi:hypothetical protein
MTSGWLGHGLKIECNLSGNVFFQITENTVSSTVTGKVNSGLIVSWVEFNSRETLNIDTLDLIGGGVHFSDDKVVSSGELLGEFDIHWSHFFAMTAPWGVIFDKNVFSFIHDNIFKVETDDLNDWLVLGFWVWF